MKVLHEAVHFLEGVCSTFNRYDRYSDSGIESLGDLPVDLLQKVYRLRLRARIELKALIGHSSG